jgi:hypothetical protein
VRTVTIAVVCVFLLVTVTSAVAGVPEQMELFVELQETTTEYLELDARYCKLVTVTMTSYLSAIEAMRDWDFGKAATHLRNAKTGMEELTSMQRHKNRLRRDIERINDEIKREKRR